MKRKWNVCGRAVLALAIAAAVAVQTAPRGFALAGRQEESGAPLPLSDPENSKHWKLDETLSDEFDGEALDEQKWQPIPFTWAGKWRWEDDQVAVGGGSLHLTARHARNSTLDQSPNGWNTHIMYDGDSENGEFVSTQYGSRSGEAALVYANFFPIWVRTDATIAGLDPAKSYSFSVWVKRAGHSSIAQMYACDPAVKSIPLAPAEIREFGQSEDFVQYSITGITPNAAGQCKIGFEIKADPYAVTVLDDVSFAAEGEGGVNLAPNPGFEDITPMNYASGGIISRNTMKYGYMETRAKGAPALPGACSAIWLLGRTDDWGTEIDVLEIGQTSTVNELDFAVHTFKTRDSVKTPRQDVNPHGSAGIWGNRNSFNPSEAYHVYGLEWGPGYQKFYVDGTLMGEFYGSTKAPESGGPAAQWQTSSTGHANNMNAIPQSLLLSLGLRPPYRDGNDPSLNTTFDVDYIRVWRADNQEAKGDIREVVTNEGNLVVPYGTSEAELLARLPATVPVLVGTPAQKLSLLNQRDVPVNWEVSGFSGEAAGVTTVLRGTLGELPQGVANPAGLAASLNIYVQNGERGVDKTALQALADRPYTEAEYTATSWNSYLAARAAARAVLADEEATAGEVLAAYEALNEAIKALKPAPNLDALLARRLDAGKYTAPTWWEYTTARSAAQAVQAGGSAAAGETEAAYERLWTAIQQLEELPEGENVLQGKMPAADVSVQNAAAATDGVIPDTGWGPDTDKTVYTTLLAGAEGGADNGYAGWPGAYLEYDLGEEQPIQRLEIYRSWYATDLRSVTWKDCRVELCATPDFAPEATVSAGPADYVLNSDTDVSQLGRRQPQIVELEQPARARYIRVYGRGHLGGWGNYSARMSYGEIRALKAPDPQWDELNGLVAQARQAAGGELDPEPAGRLQAALDAAQALPADADAAAVNEAYALLKTALKAAGPAPETLESLVARAEALQGGEYLPSSWAVFAQALDTARAALERPEERDAARAALRAAMDALVPAENVLLGLLPDSDAEIENPAAATDGSAAAAGWSADSDKSGYTTIFAGQEGGEENGYGSWPGAYLQYDLGRERSIAELVIHRSWYAADLRPVTWKDCMIQLSTEADFAPEHTVTAGPGDLAQPGDTEAAGTARAGAQLVRLDAPAAARYIRVYGRGHPGGWGNYSARMSYAEILAFSTD